jgi:hypothetical protein
MVCASRGVFLLHRLSLALSSLLIISADVVFPGPFVKPGAGSALSKAVLGSNSFIRREESRYGRLEVGKRRLVRMPERESEMHQEQRQPGSPADEQADDAASKLGALRQETQAMRSLIELESAVHSLAADGSWQTGTEDLGQTAVQREQKGQADSSGQLAVLIVGLQDRLLMASKLQRVVLPTVKAGWGVDLYIEVVKSGNQSKAIHEASRVEDQVDDIETHIHDFKNALNSSVPAVGGTLAHFELREEEEDVSFVKADHKLPRWEQFPPDQPVGSNVLRRFKTLEKLMNIIKDKKKKYDFVLVTRDDDYWLGPFHVDNFIGKASAELPARDLIPQVAQAFANEAKHSEESIELFKEKAANRVYSKDCMEQHGINDKTLLFGAKAAEAFLSKIYSDFWIDDQRLIGVNPESFLQGFASVKGVNSKAVPFEWLPTADSVYKISKKTGKIPTAPFLCQKRFYTCHADYPKNMLPASSDFQAATYCDGFAWNEHVAYG